MTDPKDMTRLVERLRGLAEHNRQHFPVTAEDGFIALGDEAADAITTLLEEVARKDAALDEIMAEYRQYSGAVDVMFEIARDARAALQGSVDRLNDERISE